MQNRGAWLAGLVMASSVVSAGSVFAEDVSAELNTLKQRIAELEKKETENWLNEERKSEIRSLVREVIDDARQRGQFADGAITTGYKDGFYVTDGTTFRLQVGGFIQTRYSYYRHTNTPTRRVNGTSSGRDVTPNNGDAGDANGFDVRRARVSFSGFAVNPDLTYKLEGDFYGGSDAGFTVTDAFVAYKVNEYFRVKAGSFKVPFAKAELTGDTNLGLMERPEVLLPFDPVRAIGLSIYGDIVKDTLGYEVNVNNGAKSNTLKGVDTYAASQGTATRTSANLDNRLSFYGRVGWAGAGKLSDFGDEPDLRSGDRPFIWMLGGAAGYESQNNSNNAFPSPQGSVGAGGVSTADQSGFLGTQTLNGDLFRGTVDWSGKVGGWSLIAAGYFQQFNYNYGDISSGAAPSTPAQGTGPYGPGDSSFFQWGTYGQVGYMINPQWEVVGRAGLLVTEGYPNYGEWYTIGTNYYFYKHAAKVALDFTYSPEAAYTDASSGNIVNTHEFGMRVQFQLKF